MSRCKACDAILVYLEDDLCNTCRGKSMEIGSIHDREYVHGTLTDVFLDGTTLKIEDNWQDDPWELDIGENK